MPRKRRDAKQRRADAVRPLSRSVMGLLLFGWTPARRAYGMDDPLAPYLLREDDIKTLMRERAPEIEREARRRGVARPWAATFDDEGRAQ